MKPSHILVVDDDSSLRRVMKMQLEEAGYQVSLANDGEEAWKMLREVEPQLIITDLRMPTTGLELLRRISEEGLQTTVIVMTAFGTIEIRGGSDEDGRLRLRHQANRFRSAVLMVPPRN